MRSVTGICSVLLLFASCKTSPNSDKQYADLKGNTVFQLRLNPADFSQYHYDISNESEIQLEVDDKKVKNIRKTNAELSYDIHKDSAGNFLLNMHYDKIHLYSKNGEIETDIDADNVSFSSDIAEKMLGILKQANIEATVNPRGETQSIKGYKELGEKLIAGLNTTDINVKKMAQSQLDKLIGEEFVKKNIDQLFKMFPDSAVHVGDKWKLNSRQGGDFNFTVKNFYTLKNISNDIASISSEGEMMSDNSTTNFEGYGDVSMNLNGEQEGEYKMETKTGMLLSSNVSAKIKGTVVMMGREVPVVIKNSIKIEGRKVK